MSSSEKSPAGDKPTGPGDMIPVVSNPGDTEPAPTNDQVTTTVATPAIGDAEQFDADSEQAAAIPGNDTDSHNGNTSPKTRTSPESPKNGSTPTDEPDAPTETLADPADTPAKPAEAAAGSGTGDTTRIDLVALDEATSAAPSAAAGAEDPAADAGPTRVDVAVLDDADLPAGHAAAAEDTADGEASAASPAGAVATAGQAGLADEAAGSKAADGVTRGRKTAGDGGSPPRGPGGVKGPKKPEKKRSRPVRYARRFLWFVLGFLGLCIAGFAVAYLFTPVPSPQEAALAQGPTFYYADGRTVIAKTGVNRDAVKLDQIPPSVRNAVIAAENRSFYKDPGVSVSGTARAFWSTATGEQLQGGSTITQQMVRNYYGGIGKERSVTRKLKEVMVSLKVGREKNKDWILEQYLNTIYFGRDAYGVQAAAKAYYGKDVKDLTAAEGAYLAAAIQQPSNFADPSGPRQAYAEQRWRAVVDNMVRDGAVSSADAAAMKFPLPVKEKITNILKGQKGYMVNVAKKELVERRGYSEDEINRSGLKITTTFDKKLMDAAKQAVTSNTPSGMSKKIRTAVVSVDPATGQVLAFYGGRDYLTEALSSAFGDWAQAGSGFKPIALAAALDDGKSLTDTYDGSSPQYFNGQDVNNDSGENFGMVNLVTATEHSINTAYVNLGQDIGNDKIAQMAEKMGISAGQMEKSQRAAPVFPLGIVSLHPVQQAGVYATFAADGRHRAPYVVKSVTDNQDHTKTFNERGDQAFGSQVARDATYAMQQVVEGGTGTAARLPDGRDVAGKTGTTDQGRAIWFNGFIPQMATTVAMFRSDNKPLDIPGYGSYGGQLPARIWSSYMGDAVNIKNYAPKEFESPSVTPGDGYGVPTAGTRPDTGEPPRSSTPTRKTPSSGPPNSPRSPSHKPSGRPSSPGTGGGGSGGGGGTVKPGTGSGDESGDGGGSGSG